MRRLLTISLMAAQVSAFAQHHDANTNTDVDVHMGGMGIDMNINVNETYTETHTTTTTTTATGREPDYYYMPGYRGPIGCPWPMDDGQFSDARRSVGSKDFENSKLTVAKQITGSNCLTAAQVRDMMGEFDFENSKLEYAKFAYSRTYDTGNYYKLNDAFDFEASIDELNEYINGR